MTWLEDAACRGMDQRIFYPRRGEDTAAAKQVCAGCDVREQCLAEALDMEVTGKRYGVRGGLAPRQRDQEARRLRIPFSPQHLDGQVVA